MPFQKKKRSFKWHLEQKLTQSAMWHKKQIRAFRKKYNISEYKMMWIVFTKGFILGALLMQCQKLITLE